MTTENDPIERDLEAAIIKLATGELPTERRTSWAPVSAYFDGELPPPPTPTILSTRQGTSLILPATTNLLFGASTVGKTWIALVAAAQELRKGNRVLWIDYEYSLDKLRNRLDTLRVPRDRWNLLDYVSPRDALTVKGGTSNFYGMDFLPLVASVPYSFAVVDALTGALSVEGLDPNVGPDVEALYRVLGKTLTDYGAAVLFIDHEGKSKERDVRYSIGSERKLSGLTGVSLRAEGVTPFGRATYDTLRGEVHIKVAKDREGYLTNGTDQLIARVEYLAHPDGKLDVHVDRAADVVLRPPEHVLRAVVAFLREEPGSSGNAVEKWLIAEGVAADKTIRKVVKWLGTHGYAQRRGTGWYLNEDQVAKLDGP